MRFNKFIRSVKNANLSTVKRFITEAALGIIRNSLMAVSCIATVATCVFIVVFSYCIAANVSFIMNQLEDTVGITAIIDDSLSAEEINVLYDEIYEMENVKGVEYISAHEALERLSEKLGDSQGIIMGLENDNPLRRSFAITLDNIRNQNKVLSQLKSTEMYNKGVVSVNDSTVITDILIPLNNVVRVVSSLIITVLVLLSVIIIMNTIKLTVNSRKNEINIMKYIGATDWFIKWPFLLEGVFIGILGAVIPVFICFLGYDSIIYMIMRNFTFLSSLIKFKDGGAIFPALTPLMILLGIAIGSIGSIISMRKYLDV